MRKKILLLSLVVMLVMSLVAMGCPAPAPTPSPPPPAPTPSPAPTPTEALPEVITIASYELGMVYHLCIAVPSDIMTEKYGVKMRVIPIGTTAGRLMMLRSGDAQVLEGDGGSCYGILEGIEEYAVRQWGPHPLRVIRMGLHPGYCLATRGDSDVYTMADLKGKKIPYVPGLAGTNLFFKGILAYAGLTTDDVELVNFSSWLAQCHGGMAGKADVAVVNVTGSYCYEWQSQPGGMRYIETPASNTEGWKRLNEVLPFYFPYLATSGAEISPENPYELPSQPGPLFLCSPELPEHVAYFLAKGLEETYDESAAKVKQLEVSGSLKDQWIGFEKFVAPIHEGAIRYYKEIGEWTPEREALNERALEHQAGLKAVWEATLDEALSLGITDAEFSDFWLKKRAEAGF